MISKKDKILISKNGTAKIYFLFFSSIFVVFLEMLGIGSVPMFAYILIEPQSSIIELLRKFNYPVDNFDLSASLFASCIIGPSAIGSEKGSPNSIMSG